MLSRAVAIALTVRRARACAWLARSSSAAGGKTAGGGASQGFAICEHRAVWVISRRRLREFWERHPQAEVPLRAWFQVASRAEWQHVVDVRRDFPHADAVGRWTVFNIGGNDFRLVAEIVYATHKVFIRFVGTHQEYDRGRWK